MTTTTHACEQVPCLYLHGNEGLRTMIDLCREYSMKVRWYNTMERTKIMKKGFEGLNIG